MQAIRPSQQYAPLPIDAENGPVQHPLARRRKPRYNYKPTVIRAPVLICFALIPALCVILIEQLLKRAARPEEENSEQADLHKRYLEQQPYVATVNANESCQQLNAITTRIISLEEAGTSLCSRFSASYGTKTALTPAQITPFQRWLSTFDDLDLSWRQATSDKLRASRDCGDDGTVTMSDPRMNPESSVSVRMGCVTKILPVGCDGEGKIMLKDGSLTMSSTTWCTASQSPMSELRKKKIMRRTTPMTTPALITTPAAVTTTPPTTAPSTPATTNSPAAPTTSSSFSNVYYSTTNLLIFTTTTPKTTKEPDPTTSASTSYIAYTSTNLLQFSTTTKKATPTPFTSDVLIFSSTTTPKTTAPAAEVTITYKSTNLLDFSTTMKKGEASPTTTAPAAVITITNKSSSLLIFSTTTKKEDAPPTPFTSNTLIFSTTTKKGDSTPTPFTSTVLIFSTTSNNQDKATTSGAVMGIGQKPTSSYTSIVTISVSAQTSENLLAFSTTARADRASSGTMSAEAQGTLRSSVLMTNSDGILVFASPTTDDEGASATMTDSITLYTRTTQYTSMVPTTDKDGNPTSVLALIVSEIVTTEPPSTTDTSTEIDSKTATGTAAQSTSTSTNTPAPLQSLSPNEVVVGNFNKFSYFAGLYLCPLIAVLIKAFWEWIFSAFKMIEPFQRLSADHNHGVSADRSFFVQYLSNSISIDAIRTCFSGRILPLLNAIVYLLTTALAVLATSSMTIRALGYCEVGDGRMTICNPAWIINLQIIRVLEIVAGILSFLAILVMLFSWNLRTGVTSNPSSIASIASLLNQEALIRDLRQIDPYAKETTMMAVLADHRCKLDYHDDSTGHLLYGIQRSIDKRHSYDSVKYWPGGYKAVANPESPPPPTPWNAWFLNSSPLQNYLLDALQLFACAGLFAIVVAYKLDGKSDPFNNFFNSGSFWARFVFVASASFVDILWKRLEREVRITEPYRRMNKDPDYGDPETTVLMTLNGTCWSRLPESIYKLFKFKHMWYQTLVTFVACVSDFNIIAAAGVAWSTAQSQISLDTSCYLVSAVTGLMMLTMLVTIIWWRSTVVNKMPRCPETVGVIFSYLCASRFTNELRVMDDDVTEEERNDIIISTGWRFSFKEKIGLDGRQRWCIDYENYSGGGDYIKPTSGYRGVSGFDTDIKPDDGVGRGRVQYIDYEESIFDPKREQEDEKTMTKKKPTTTTTTMFQRHDYSVVGNNDDDDDGDVGLKRDPYVSVTYA